jgi:hypothetical protein
MKANLFYGNFYTCVPSTKLPIIIEALKLNAPAGVEVTIKKVCFHYFWDRPTKKVTRFYGYINGHFCLKIDICHRFMFLQTYATITGEHMS